MVEFAYAQGGPTGMTAKCPVCGAAVAIGPGQLICPQCGAPAEKFTEQGGGEEKA